MRTALVLASVLVLVAGLAGVALRPGAGRAEGARGESAWPGYGGGPAHAFFAPAGPSPSLYPRWWAGAEGPVRGGVTLASGLAVAGSDAGVVLAIRVADGSPAWRFGPVSSVEAVPAALGGQLYVACSGGALYALDADTGFPRWKFQTPSWISASPLVSGGRVTVACYSGVVSALDPASGSLVWQASVGDDFVSAAPAGDGERVYLGTVRGRLLALDARTGEVAWQRRLDGRLEHAPALAGGALVQVTSGEDGGVWALDAATGEDLWAFSAPPGRWSAPALDESRAYVVNGDEVFCLSLRGGALEFRSRLSWDGAAAAPGGAAPGGPGRALLAGGRLFVLTGAGTEAEAPPRRSGAGEKTPAGEGAEGVGAADGAGPALWALDPADGAVLWRCTLPAEPASWPATDGDSLYVGTRDGKLYRLSPLEVWVGDRPIPFAGAWPVVEQGRLWAPVRTLWEALGAAVEWLPGQQRARVGWGGATLELEVGRGWAGVGDGRVDLGAAPRTAAGRLLAPVRPVAEALGVEVVWEPEFPRAILLPRAPGPGGE